MTVRYCLRLPCESRKSTYDVEMYDVKGLCRLRGLSYLPLSMSSDLTLVACDALSGLRALSLVHVLPEILTRD